MGEPGSAIEFVKGHGTGNDFVIIPDLGGILDLTASVVAKICDRRFGIGGDGVLRVVRGTADPAARAWAREVDWFMDYRNADGSIAEMCGNGARVFARYLLDAGLIDPGSFRFATRAGVVTAEVSASGVVSITMGSASAWTDREVRVTHLGRSWPAVAVAAPNPHAVVFLGDDDDPGSLEVAPVPEPADVFPDGVNVEFVRVLSDAHLRMRVHERGVGETRSCGTGACAVAWAHWRRNGSSDPVRVDVPGGVLIVGRSDDESLILTGPTALVAKGEFLPRWWEASP